VQWERIQGKKETLEALWEVWPMFLQVTGRVVILFQTALEKALQIGHGTRL
jgi:hypothetical protein